MFSVVASREAFHFSSIIQQAWRDGQEYMDIYSHVLPTIQKDPIDKLNQAFSGWNNSGIVQETKLEQDRGEDPESLLFHHFRPLPHIHTT